MGSAKCIIHTRAESIHPQLSDLSFDVRLGLLILVSKGVKHLPTADIYKMAVQMD